MTGRSPDLARRGLHPVDLEATVAAVLQLREDALRLAPAATQYREVELEEQEGTMDAKGLDAPLDRLGFESFNIHLEMSRRAGHA